MKLENVSLSLGLVAIVLWSIMGLENELMAYNRVIFASCLNILPLCYFLGQKLYKRQPTQKEELIKYLREHIKEK